MKVVLIFLVCSLFSTGCSSSVSRIPLASSDQSHKFTRLEQPAGKLIVKYSEEGKKTASDNLTFNIDKLTSTIKRALEAGNMLIVSNESSQPTIDVVITNVYARSTVNAFLWGFMAGADSIEGDVTVHSSSGQQLHKFKVSTSYALGGFAGFEESRMGWLYENFSKDILKELKGGEES